MKDSFVMRTENKVSIDRMSNEDAGRLLKAILAHVAGEEIDEGSEPLAVQLLLPLITGQIDRAEEKYQETCERRREAGQKGGQAKASNAKQTLANGSKAKQTLVNDSKPKHNDPDPEPDIKETTLTGSKEKFAAAWDAYPKKQGRKEAEAAYLRAIRDGTAPERILAGIDAYKAYIARCHIDDQYVKQGSTFFRQQAWNDDWTGSRNVKPPEHGFTERHTDYDALLNAIGG